MLDFFKESFISFPFPPTDKFQKSISFLENKNIRDYHIIYHIHFIISYFLFFHNKIYVNKKFLFQKNIFSKNSVKIDLMSYKKILFIKKTLDYDSQEYFLSIYCLNNLRKIIPTFTYTFFSTPNTLWMEYNHGITLSQYLKNILTQKEINLQKEGKNFLSIFFQILFSLELAQDQYLFTHYDLHLDNIMILKNKFNENLYFPIYHKKYIFYHPTSIISIFDFEHSCGRFKDHLIHSNHSHLYRYGYLSIFQSGVDILRLLFCFYLSFLKYKDSPFFTSLFQFLDYIMTSFFHFKPIDMSSLTYHSSFFFNTTFSKRNYKTPLELLLFLKKNEIKISSFFSLHSLPFSVQIFLPSEKKLHFSPFQNSKQHISFHLFCSITTSFHEFISIYSDFQKLNLIHRKMIPYKNSFRFFYIHYRIPSVLLKKSIKIYRYLNTLEQTILFRKRFQENLCSCLTIELHKIKYL